MTKAPSSSRATRKSPEKPATRSKRAAPARASEEPTFETASAQIDARIRTLGGWRGATLARMRELILEAVPSAIEECKWMGTPVWSSHGIICTGEAYKQVVKLTFARGAAIDDPSRLFNSSLEGNTRRAIDIREGESVDAEAFKALVRAAAAQNAERAKPSSALREERAAKLLSGDNPQIAKADGSAPVQAYIDAMPGWKREVGRKIDALITAAVPSVTKAVKWNSPFYGVEANRWFVSFHTFARYVKIAFFRGTSLRPMPPGESKSDETRYLDVHERDAIDEAQITAWMKQAAALPGLDPGAKKANAKRA